MKMRILFVAAASVALIGTAFADDLYVSDFESDDGGWVATADWDPVGDWEWGEYDIANYIGLNNPPPAAHSGTHLWATKLNDDYTNSGGNSWLSQTFDFSGFVNVHMTFASWAEVFFSFDTAQLFVNGDLVYERETSDPPADWEILDIDLSAYDNLSEVEIVFQLFATTVVNRAGWYVDDVRISGDADIPCLELTVDNLVGGNDALFTVTGGAPGERGLIVWGLPDTPNSSFTDVKGWCATFGFNINMQGRKFRIVGSDIFDNNGQVQVTKPVAENLTGRELLFQAAEHNTCPSECTSKVVDEVVG